MAQRFFDQIQRLQLLIPVAQVLVRYLTADFPETEHCAGSYLRWGENSDSSKFTSPSGSTMRPHLPIHRDSIIQGITPRAASTSSPRRFLGLTSSFSLKLTLSSSDGPLTMEFETTRPGDISYYVDMIGQ